MTSDDQPSSGADEPAGRPSKRFRLKERAGSFGPAFRGLVVLVRSQHNAWVHAVASGVVVAAGIGLGVSAADWCWLVAAMTAVWTTEALNTAVEFLGDAVTQEFNPAVRDAKDVAAGAVLLAAAGAAAVGLVVFWPHVARLLQS